MSSSRPGTGSSAGGRLSDLGVGPGINDNGSGSAGILEIAEQMAKVKPRNQVRFIWFEAEESGLLGSEEYVDSLSQADRDKIAAMLNFEMIGSPNFVRFVYDGDLSDSEPPPRGAPAGSAQIERLFLDYFAGEGLETEPTGFDGRSDYGPFIEVGIPAGGLFTGAEGIKTPAQVAVYGGTAGQQYDPCYHLGCDDTGNLSTLALEQMSDAAAHATIPLAQSTQGDQRPAWQGQLQRAARRTPGPLTGGTRGLTARVRGAGVTGERRRRSVGAHGAQAEGFRGARPAAEQDRSRRQHDDPGSRARSGQRAAQ